MVIDFTSDEQFHQWCEDHQDDGFFVGYGRGYPPQIPRASTNIPRMHRASCKVATTRARSNYVGRLFEKKWLDRSARTGAALRAGRIAVL